MLASQLAAAVSSLRYEDLQPEVVHAAQRKILDALGVALGGLCSEEAQLTLRAARSWGGPGPCVVWGTDVFLAAPHAALVNGTSAHARELDDVGAGGHPGAAIVPAALAAAQMSQTSGRDLITAIVAGYETAVRVILSLGGYSAVTKRGYHGITTAPVFGAAVSAAHLLRLDAQHMAWAIGLTGSHTGGIWAFNADGAMSKRLHAGKAAETGLVAALLAREGFTGPGAIFEPGLWGSFLTVFGRDTARPEALVDGLNLPFTKILTSGFKPYANCRDVHGPIDAVLHLKAAEGVSAGDVLDITVRASGETMRSVGKLDLSTVMAAQMSLPYGIALAFLLGYAGQDQYEAASLGDPVLMEFARRVSMVEDPSIPDASPAVVEVHLKDGRTLAHSVRYAKGSPENPMTDVELQDKFLSLARRRLPPGGAEKLADLVWNLADLSTTEDLLKILRVPGESE